jgi:AcrR family transcriptional regulator
MIPDERDEPAFRHEPEGGPSGDASPKPKASSAKDRIVDALMELAAEREWDDFSITDVAERASVSLADFRDAYPSKGAVLAGFSKRIDRVVLEGTGTGLADESTRERLFDVLMRRIDAMGPYKLGLQSVAEWIKRNPMAAAPLNAVVINSMRFMLAAAGIEAEGGAGAIKLQGLAVAWARVLDVWYDDDEPGLARTMAALDKELTRGETLVARIDDLERLTSPLRLFGRALMDASRRRLDRRPRFRPSSTDDYDASTVV